MFTEGLDPHALKWIRENQASSATHQRMDPLRRTGTGTMLGVPPLEKFRSGHLPRTSIPVSHTLRRDSASASGSDMDESSDSEPDTYPSRYSVDSSPREDMVKRQIPRAASRYAYYSSDGYTELSSSRDTRFSQKPRPAKPDRVDGYVQEQEEESDSGVSSEFSSQLVRENGRAGVNIGPYTSNYSPSIASSAVEFGAKAGRTVKLQAEMGTSDAPSAPPIHDYTEDTDSDIRHETDQMSRLGNPNAGLGPRETPSHVTKEPDVPNLKGRTSSGAGVSKFSGTVQARSPTYHASVQGPWYSIFAYEACVRLCLNSWAKGCTEEAPIFLKNECTLLRNAFGLKNILLQPEEELLARNSSELVNEGSVSKPKKAIGRLKIQVRRVRMSTDMPTGCASLSSITTPRLESIKYRLYNAQSTFSSGWESLRRVQVLPQVSASSSFTKHSVAYMNAGAKYIKEVSSLLKMGATTLRSSSTIDSVQETYTCQLRLKSMPDDELVPMQPGSGETHVFFPDSLGDDLIMDVYDSKGACCGKVVAQVASIVEDSTDKVRWWPMYYGPQREFVGRVQLYMNYATTPDDNNPLKCGSSIAETVAYDITLEVAMKSLKFEQRNLVLHGSWKWLLTEFASYFGVSDEYARLRYLTYVMDVATPTADCLTLVHDLLLPVLMKSRSNKNLSHQENRILAEIEEQAGQILAMVFENYKSLDDSVLSGMEEVFRPPSGVPASALGPAMKLYTLLHDILSQEAQIKLCCYFQTAARKRMRRHLLETDEFLTCHADASVMDVVAFTTAYKKVISLCNNTKDEIFTDIEIHNQHILPSFVDLPHLAANIYCAELGNRLRAFLIACPPTGPSPPVADLVIATADFQKDLSSWNIRSEKTVDAKQLFHIYIMLWIEDKKRALVEACRLDEVKWSGVRTKHMTTPFVDNMFDRLTDMLTEYEVIISRWPEYSVVLENAIADVEKAIVNSLEKQYADVLSPLKESLAPKKFGLKYVQKLAKRKPSVPYVIPEELGILLNSMKRLLDLLLPRVEGHLRSWESCLQGGVGGTAAGERLSEAAVILRSKFRNYTNAIVEKLVENTHLQSTTKLKKIMKDSKEMGMESDIKSRMQPLKEQLKEMINQLNKIFETQLFISVCRGFWERMGQDILSFLEHRKENRAWFKAAKVTVNGIDDTFASKMQELLGNSLKESDLQPPRKIMEVRSILCQDTPVQKSFSAYY
ncbi:hypothetical protein LUZ63_008229 [Rhynchospora breviuscula]|uniref:Pesticidal crystal cry8Ba protein n=1 Tax=Rhynchospora breviuscula TaxID=2022672 RepID=A0A9Q0HV52_9POAL|nr:hypothetical protein LUZ63_008229 [Rhynchospora breviuscula]